MAYIVVSTSWVSLPQLDKLMYNTGQGFVSQWTVSVGDIYVLVVSLEDGYFDVPQ